MKTQDILKELEFNNGTFQRKAVEQAIAAKKQIIPELLSIVEEAKQNAQELVHQGNYIAHIYAMYLLAQFRERRAYPLIVDFFSIPGEITMDLAGEVVTEDLGRILASVSHGDTSLMEELVENQDANEYARNAALIGMLILVARGEKSREEVMAYYQSLFRGKLEREPSHAWGGLVSCCTDLYPEEVLEDIEQAYEDGLVEEMFIGVNRVKEHLARSKRWVLHELRENQRRTFIGDTVKEMEWWACFRATEPRRTAKVTTKKQTKVGRNDPCPCGSGRKYKRCCGSKRR